MWGLGLFSSLVRTRDVTLPALDRTGSDNEGTIAIKLYRPLDMTYSEN